MDKTTMTSEEFGAASLRLARTRSQFARMIRVAPTRVSEWCSGARVVPPYIAALVDALLVALEARDAAGAILALWDSEVLMVYHGYDPAEIQTAMDRLAGAVQSSPDDPAREAVELSIKITPELLAKVRGQDTTDFGRVAKDLVMAEMRKQVDAMFGSAEPAE